MGARGYEAKVKRREDEMAPLYRTVDESGVTRAKKKLFGKSTWFKGEGGGGGRRAWSPQMEIQGGME